MSGKKKYFAELEEELKNLPLKERLLQELSDHVEDLEQEEANTLNIQKMNRKIGDPKYIKTSYYSILNPLRGLYFLAEGLFCGLLLLPLGMVSFLSQGMLTNIFYPASLGGDRSFLTILSILLGLGFFCFLWFIAFSSAFKHWRKLTKTTGYPLRFWIPLMLFPTVAIWGSFFVNSLNLFLECPRCNEYPMSDLASIVAPIIISSGVLFLAGHLAWKKSKLPLRKSKIQWSKGIDFILALYLVAYGLLRTGATYELLEWMSVEDPSLFMQFLMQLFTPLFFFEYLTLLLVNSLGHSFTSGVWTIGFIALVLFFLVVQWIVDLIKNKKITWLRAGVAWWALSLLLVNPHVYAPTIEWQKSALPISENIEKEQHGILYGLLKYSNQSEGRFYRYNVEWSDAEFIVTQNSGEAFRINPEKLDEGTYTSIVDSSESNIEFQNEQVTLVEGLKCVSQDLGMENTKVADFFNCSQLEWQGASILEVEYSIIVSDLAFSEDGTWLILVLQSGFYDPEYVYLVEL